MRDKKSPSPAGTGEGAKRSLTRDHDRTVYGPRSTGRVTIYEGGAQFTSPHRVPHPRPPDAGGKRGTIVQWSSASRRRMRHAMLTLGAPPGALTLGGTFTVPGPVLTVAESKLLWWNFSRALQRLGWGAIWRAEVQQRGAIHWHAVVITPTPELCETRLRGLRTPVGHEHYATDCAYELAYLWARALDSLGPRVFIPPWRGKDGTLKPVAAVPGLSHMPGAQFRACVVESDGGRGAWLRYLQDHASKRKQEQVAEGIGRHWGIVGRGRFVQRDPLAGHELPAAQWFRVMRMLQRLATSSEQRPACPFGRALQRRNRRGSFGRSTWYSRPDTLQRMIDWAQREA